MSQTISLDATTTKKVVHKLQQLEELKTVLLASIPEKSLPYGSNLWWEKVEIMADNDIRKGNIQQFHSMEELINDLHR